MDISSQKHLPYELYDAESVRELDRMAIEKFNLPGLELMQRAGASAFSVLQARWPATRRLLLFTGGGNNAGDGYIVAGLAIRAGLSVSLLQLQTSDALAGDAAAAAQWAQDCGVHFERYDSSSSLAEHLHLEGTVIVDALLGTGLNRDVDGLYAHAISQINLHQAPVLSIDIPSGLSADTGNVFAIAVQADVTVSFIGMKKGLLTAAAVDYCGEIHFDGLDLPEQLFRDSEAPRKAAERIDIRQQNRYLRPRRASAHKGKNGHVVIIGGDSLYGGAVLMSAEAALRSGSGLVSVVTRSMHRPAVLSRRPEIMVMGTEDEESSRQQRRDLLGNADAIVVGPGLGKSSWSQARLAEAIEAHEQWAVPIVIDADGLNLIAQSGEDYRPFTARACILTPHPGEAARLLSSSILSIQCDRFESVRRLQRLWGGVCLLKGAGSLICGMRGDEAQTFLSTEGNAAMSSAGMGDVLSGILGSLLGQGYPPLLSTTLGVCVHGEAADLAVESRNAASILATDLLDFLPQLLHPR